MKLGHIEAFQFGVQIIFTPFHDNHNVNGKAVGIIQYNEITEQSVYKALQKALMVKWVNSLFPHNPALIVEPTHFSYISSSKQNAKVVSKAYVDRLTSILQTAGLSTHSEKGIKAVAN